MRGDEPDDGRADQERGVPEAHDHRQPPAAADVTGKTIDLGSDQADTETDEAPADEDDREVCCRAR